MPHSDPFRLRIQKRVTQVLKDGVNPAATGFQVAPTFDLRDRTEAGEPVSHVWRGRTEYGYDDVLPLVSVLEDPGTVDELLGGRSGGDALGSYPLIITGFVKDDPLNPTDPAHILAAECIQAIAAQRKAFNHFGMGGDCPCINDFKLSSHVVRPADGEVSDVAWFVFRLTLELTEDLERPFS